MNAVRGPNKQGQVEVVIWDETQHRPLTFLTNLTDSDLDSIIVMVLLAGLSSREM